MKNAALGKDVIEAVVEECGVGTKGDERLAPMRLSVQKWIHISKHIV